MKTVPLFYLAALFGLTLSACGISQSEFATQASAEEETATPYPSEITDTKGVSMRLVPAGEFTMGSEGGEAYEQPVHTVYLDHYYIDKYEVTNIFYRTCVDEGACKPPIEFSSFTRPSYYSDPKFDNFPVIYVDWDRAQTYCEWRGGSLPTEAQWEKAARGTDGRMYPWGDGGEDKTRANFQEYVGDTTLVGSYESGKSPYDVYDMAGNVFEWVADWYSETYYLNSPTSNPLGPESGEFRLVRGGSWSSVDLFLSTFSRSMIGPEPDFAIGFRCARDANA